MRLIIAAVLGGVVMFMWGAFSHVVLGIENSVFKPIPNEAAVIAALKANIPESGFYFLPGLEMSREPTAEEMAVFTAKHEAGPNAMLIYHPDGSEVMPPSQMLTELLSNIAAAFAAALILTFAAVSFGRGVIISTLLGLIGWLSITVSHWNWFRFPANFTITELTDQLVGWFLSGLVLAYVLRRRS